MSGRMEGKVALVTGGAGGIPSACGRLFCAEGAAVALVDVDGDRAKQTAETIRGEMQGARIIGLAADTASEHDAAKAVEATVAEFGALSTVVNAAAVRVYGQLADVSAESWARIIDVNLLGVANFCRAAMPHLRDAQGASIVNVSSVFGVIGRTDMGQYDATKAAVVSMTRTLACEEAQRGVRVNVVCPGSTWTPFTSGRAKERGLTEEELRTRGMMAGGLIGRWAQPEEIAYPIMFLASDEASFITGSVLMVDGGFSVM